ncbi:DNA-binding GntR family transcriptional regulator [Pigmentiphaga kullae]|uniref:DNA-binding GntR family transcriptional regulator n=1 Tax=Pigmentiphaga kullae TaxID=151784 RepID=A0A4V2F3N1_9BURK|nr:DNA-binding GntR family transcriptional regulator [Pigmentiphaga kullae]
MPEPSLFRPFVTRPLTDTLAADIHRYIATQGLGAGQRLPERALAEQFRVSRSPIRRALERLAVERVVEARPEGGYVVTEAAMRLPREQAEEAYGAASEDDVYFRIARERLAGLLPDRFTESEFMRRYGVTRGELAAILRRMAQEGWAERLPGHGWAFLPTLASAEAYGQGYRFRLMLESGGILEPSFKLDREALLQCRAEQEALVAGAVHTASPAYLFDANSRLHETIAACSGNAFILDALKRLDRLRRLMEYQKAVDRQQAERRCREHLVLIDLLLSGQREAAADFMRVHLRQAAIEKQAGPHDVGGAGD